MKNKILWILTFIPLIVTAIVMPFMDDQIPAHYDLAGNVDRWGSKYENYIFPIIIIVMTFFWQLFLTYFRKKQLSENSSDKDKKEAANNEKVIYAVAVGMAIMFGIMHYFFMYSAFMINKSNLTKMTIDSNKIISVLLGVFIIFSGNIIPKAKRNSLVGLRTKWSMENDQTWAVSNRFGGKVLIIAGIITIIQAIILDGILTTFVSLGVIIIASTVCVVYSCKVYKKYK